MAEMYMETYVTRTDEIRERPRDRVAESREIRKQTKNNTVDHALPHQSGLGWQVPRATAYE